MAERDRRKEDQEDPGGFLRRWSKRKAEARRAEPAPDDAATRPEPGREDPAAGGATGRAATDQTREVEPVDPRDLPDIDSLHQGSDFKVFMRPGVPPELRTQALRRLWRVDPSFSKLDGLVEYGEDYTISKRPQEAIRTAYQVGRGFVNQSEQGQAAAPVRPRVAEAEEPDPARSGGEPPAAAAETAGGPPEPGEGAGHGDPAGQETPAEASRAAPPEEPAAAPDHPRRRPLPRRG